MPNIHPFSVRPGRGLTAALVSVLVFGGSVGQSGAVVGTAKTEAKWEPEIHAFEARDRVHPPPKHAILFIGSSSIRKWKTLAEDFPGKQVINRGFGGSEIHDSTYFAGRILFPYQPRIIVLYAGDNDLAAGESPDGVAADFRQFVAAVHARLPQTRILFIAIKPCRARWKLVEKVRRANALVKAFTEAHPRLTFVDIFTPMLGADGKPRPELLAPDGLHPSRRCYELWASRIRPLLQ
jgi:lysophospholipase L1-like esterase